MADLIVPVYIGTSISSGLPRNRATEAVWEVLLPTSTTNMTLVPNSASLTSSAPAFINAAHNLGMKASFSVFAPYGVNGYNAVFTNASLRQQLFQQIVGVFNDYDFDGVNLDWECDNDPNLRAADVTNFYAELYAILNPMGKTISATENYGKVVMTPEAANYLAWVGLMIYDVGESWATGYGTLAYFQNDLNRWANAGFPKSKLVGGMTCAPRDIDGAWYGPGYAGIISTYNPLPSANQAGGQYYGGFDLTKQKAQFVKDNGFKGIFPYYTQTDAFSDYRSLLLAISQVFGDVTPPTEYSLNISVSGSGTTNPVAGNYSYQSGASITITQQAVSGWHFDHWIADGVSYTATSISFVMNSNTTIQAVFIQDSQPPVNGNVFGLDSGDATYNEEPNHLQANRFLNNAKSGYVVELQVKMNQSSGAGKVQLGIYSDNNGIPGSLLGYGECIAGSDWTGIIGLNIPVIKGNYYWLAYNLNSYNIVEYKTAQPTNSHVWGNATYGAMPSTFPTIQYQSETPYVMRAIILNEEVNMPVFAPGQVKSPTAKVTVNVAGLPCTCELFVGPNDTTKVATSGKKSFTSSITGTTISLPITMPTTGGVYHVYIDVEYQGVIFLAFVDPADVTIIGGTIEPPIWG
jgi:hypothetical protein